MFTVGLGTVANTAFALSTMAIAIPTGVKIFNWIGTLWGGSINIKAPLLFAVGFITMFIIGGLSGVMHASPPTDSQQQDTYFIVAHLHYVLFGGSIFALFAGIYFWWPKITGRMLNDGVGKLHFWLTFIGFNLAFFPMHFLGMDGMPRRIHTYSSGMGWDLWNMVSTIGAFIIGASVLVFLHSVFNSLRKGERAGNDPWDGRTLEWSIPSPPPVYNFVEIPTVHGRDAYWEQKYGNGNHQVAPVPVAGGSDDADQERGGVHGQATGTAEHGSDQQEGHHGIHLPGPSYYPVLIAVGLTIAGYGVIFHETLTWAMAAVGAGIAMVGAYAWSFEPASEGPEPADE